MNLYQLYYFKTLARLEHYTKAAEELHMTQPSLSHAISSLEEELGVRLFEKQGRNIKLTRCGKLFVPYVEDTLKELEAGIKRMKDLTCESNRVVNLAHIYTLSSHFIPNLINGFTQGEMDGNIKFSIEEGQTKELCSQILVQGLKEEKHDLIFISLIPDDPEIEFICLGEQDLVALIPNNCPLSKQDAIDLKDTEPYPLIQFTGRLGLKREINNLFRERNIIPKVHCEVSDEIAMAGLVSANLGIAIVPDSPVYRNFNVAVRPIKKPSYVRKIYLGYIKHRFLSPSVQSFKDYIIDTYTNSYNLDPLEYGLSRFNSSYPVDQLKKYS